MSERDPWIQEMFFDTFAQFDKIEAFHKKKMMGAAYKYGPDKNQYKEVNKGDLSSKGIKEVY